MTRLRVLEQQPVRGSNVLPQRAPGFQCGAFFEDGRWRRSGCSSAAQLFGNVLQGRRPNNGQGGNAAAATTTPATTTVNLRYVLASPATTTRPSAQVFDSFGETFFAAAVSGRDWSDLVIALALSAWIARSVAKPLASHCGGDWPGCQR